MPPYISTDLRTHVLAIEPWQTSVLPCAQNRRPTQKKKNEEEIREELSRALVHKCHEQCFIRPSSLQEML
jgi:hypothetical protein